MTIEVEYRATTEGEKKFTHQMPVRIEPKSNSEVNRNAMSITDMNKIGSNCMRTSQHNSY